METSDKRKPEEADEGDQDTGWRERVCVYQLEDQEYEEVAWDPDYFDDRTGEMLDIKLVKAAENEEIAFMHKIKVGEECDPDECWKMTGKAPVTTKFVRVNKGTKVAPDVRARLCGRDSKVKGESDDLFAAMPPLEGKQLLFRQATRSKRI